MSTATPERTIHVSELEEGAIVPKGVTVLSVEGTPICGAIKKNGKGRCHGKPMDNGRCRMHGGPTPIGLASPHIRHGRYSRSLPERLAASFEEAIADPEILNLQSEIGLVNARLQELLERLSTGESGALWRAVQVAYQRIRTAREADDPAEMTKALNTLGELIEVGMNDQAIWSEVHGTLEARRKLVETEQKRLVAMKNIVTAEQAMSLVTATVGILRKYVTDPRSLMAASQELADIADR